MKFQVEINDRLLKSLDILDREKIKQSIQHAIEKYLHTQNKHESLEIRLMLNRAYDVITIREIL